MANTFELIQTYTLATNTSGGITFSSIPQTFTHLLIRMSGRDTRDSYADDLKITINSLSSYSNNRLYGANTNAGHDGGTGAGNNYLGFVPANTASANCFSSGQILITNYTGTSFPKIFAGYSTAISSSTNQYQLGIGNIDTDNNGAITSINIQGYNSASGTLNAYSTFSLYGLKTS